ncbi:MAG: glycoside hydrolase family 3 N-terminal domain-containing protein [Verrucomicrobiota bacterium]
MKLPCLLCLSVLAILPGPAPLPARDAAASQAPVVKAQDTRGAPDERADQLIGEMTLEEKVSLLSGTQFVSHAVPRLGIPAFTMSDGPGGVRNAPDGSRGACAFPAGAALAATFDPAMAAAFGKAMGLEDRARGTDFQLGPGLNICRVPVNGRNFEYFGEDPYLASIIAVNWVKACSAQGSVPVIKHFAANNQELDRNSVDAQVDERTMHEIYLPAFKKAATEGGIVAVMCSYNRLNGFYASANDWLLNQVLKKQWGFKGLVMSDWGASHATTDVVRGLDLEMPSGQNLNFQRIQPAMANGSVTEANINGAGVGMTGWEPGAAAILQAWYLGQEGGIAVGEVLFGDVNPSGRLSSTFDKRFEDNPAFPYYPGTNSSSVQYQVEPYTEGIFYGYRGYDKAGKDPMYAFGFGLSYTTFTLSNMKVEKAGSEVHVSLDVKNTGSRAGAEVVQIYVGEEGCPIPRPRRELKGFSKVTLAPGQSKSAGITLPRESFAYWSPATKDWAVDAGSKFTIEAGISERDIRAAQTLNGL